jgi:hypothetical protein
LIFKLKSFQINKHLGHDWNNKRASAIFEALKKRF